VRNLIGKASKDKSVLDIQPLLLKVSVPAKLLNGADDGGGKKKPRDELQDRLLQKLETELRKIVSDVQREANREMAELGAKVKKEQDKDQKGDAGAHKDAAKLVDEVAQRLEDLTDGVPLSLREAIKKSGLFANKSLSSVGTWGFPSGNRGIRLRPGVFKQVGKDDRGDGDLRAALKAAKSGGYEFALVDSGPGGLVVGKSISGNAEKLAKEQAGGRGSALFGEIKHEGGQYKFLLDNRCSKNKGDHLARRIRDMVKERCGKSIKVWVTDKDRADDDEAATAAAESAGHGGAKK
jgi:hypothetical protein